MRKKKKKSYNPFHWISLDEENNPYPWLFPYKKRYSFSTLNIFQTTQRR